MVEVEQTETRIINPNKMTRKELREGNDALRRCLNPSDTGRPQDVVLLTRGVASARNELDEIVQKVMTFDAFGEEDDPHRHHDFGRVMVAGRPYFFKIDYYDQDLRLGANPLREPFRRVLTILRAEEY